MALKEFKNKVREYRRLVGVSQESLADRLGLNPAVLSTKLNNTDGATLNYHEIKGIIKALAQWEAIYTRDQAHELLGFLSLKENLFSPEEWLQAPLDRLEANRKMPNLSLLPVATRANPGFLETVESIEGEAVARAASGHSLPKASAVTFTPRHNLPAQPHPLVGRQREIEAVRGLLERADVRLLTLAGPGGTGKTRLSLQVAAGLVDDYEDGVFQVQLARLNEPGLVAQAIAHTLGIQETAQASIRQKLRHFLQNKRMLIVLDNFEQLMPARELVGELLADAPQLKILVTSRTILKIYGEYEFRVPPLSLPDLAGLNTTGPELVTVLSQNEAVMLFVQRARAARSGFVLTVENSREIVEICNLLDGLPLALELAAARVKLFAPKALLQRLTRLKMQLSELGGGASNLSERQQTMYNTLQWSYELLDEPEKRAFERLGIFVGGWSLEAANWLLSPAPEDTPDLDKTLVILEQLLDKSVVRQVEDSGGQLRFSMLRVIHEYALERLAGRSALELASTQRKHLQYFLNLAGEAEAKLQSDEQTEWLDRLEIEHANLRECLRWSLESADAEADEIGLQGMRLACKLEFFWLVRGYLSEGRNWLEAFLRLTQAVGQTQTQDYATALYHASRLARSQGDYPTARYYDETSLSIFQRSGNRAGLATVYDNLGNVARLQGDVDSAREYFEKSLTEYQTLKDAYNICRLLNSLGAIFSDCEDLEQARFYCEASLVIARRAGIKRMMALVLNNLGNTELKNLNLDKALRFYQESLVLKRELGDIKSIAVSLNNLGLLMVSKGSIEYAKELLEESLELRQRLGDKHGLAHTFHSLSEAALAQQDWEAAARYLEHSLNLRFELKFQAGIIECLVNFAILALERHQFDRAATILDLVDASSKHNNTTLNTYDKAKYERVRAATLKPVNDGESLPLTSLNLQTMTLNDILTILN